MSANEPRAAGEPERGAQRNEVGEWQTREQLSMLCVPIDGAEDPLHRVALLVRAA